MFKVFLCKLKEMFRNLRGIYFLPLILYNAFLITESEISFPNFQKSSAEDLGCKGNPLPTVL
jgi:hypothetical protein